MFVFFPRSKSELEREEGFSPGCVLNEEEMAMMVERHRRRRKDEHRPQQEHECMMPPESEGRKNEQEMNQFSTTFNKEESCGSLPEYRADPCLNSAGTSPLQRQLRRRRKHPDLFVSVRQCVLLLMVSSWLVFSSCILSFAEATPFGTSAKLQSHDNNYQEKQQKKNNDNDKELQVLVAKTGLRPRFSTQSAAAAAAAAVPVTRIVDKDALAEVDNTVDVYHPPGHEANVEEYPFFVHWSRAMCGASIVHDDILLTAGHCGRKATDPLERKEVRFGSEMRQSGGYTRAIAHLEVHPNFNQFVKEYDYQLIKLDGSTLKDDDGKPSGASIVTLNTNPARPAPGTPLQAVGFGTVHPKGKGGNSQVLMDTTLQAFSANHCQSQYGPGHIIEDIMVCLGTIDGSKDTCQGTSCCMIFLLSALFAAASTCTHDGTFLFLISSNYIYRRLGWAHPDE
jgi:hypothetical protein